MQLIEVRQHGWIHGNASINVADKSYVLIKRNNKWISDSRTGAIAIQKYESINERPMYAALTTEWPVPEQSLYIFYRDEKPPHARRTAVPKTITARSLPV